MEPARHVGASDDPQHGFIVAEPPHAEALTQVGVKVDTGHSASLGAGPAANSLWDLGYDLIEEAVDPRFGGEGVRTAIELPVALP